MGEPRTSQPRRLRMMLIGLIVALACAGCSDTSQQAQPRPNKSATPQPQPIRTITQSTSQQAGQTVVIDHVVDGDTVALTSGMRVRLVQIDTPEVYGTAECGGAAA